jgi:hypothetical protein
MCTTLSWVAIAEHNERQIAQLLAIPGPMVRGVPASPLMELYEAMRQAGYFDGPAGRQLLRGWIGP